MKEYMIDRALWESITLDARGGRVVAATRTIGGRLCASRVRKVRSFRGEDRTVTGTFLTFSAVPVGDRLTVDGTVYDVVQVTRGRDLAGRERFWRLELS